MENPQVGPLTIISSLFNVTNLYFMNNSTEGVTVLGVFFLDVLNVYKEKPEIHAELQKIVGSLDLTDPNKMQPMHVYNKMLDWIPENLGKANAKREVDKGDEFDEYLLTWKS